MKSRKEGPIQALTTKEIQKKRVQGQKVRASHPQYFLVPLSLEATIQGHQTARERVLVPLANCCIIYFWERVHCSTFTLFLLSFVSSFTHHHPHNQDKDDADITLRPQHRPQGAAIPNIVSPIGLVNSTSGTQQRTRDSGDWRG